MVVNVGNPITSLTNLRKSSNFLTELTPNVRGVRVIGSASIAMSYVCRGVLGGYISWGLHPYDIAAGVICVQECGGEVWTHDGEKGGVGDRDIVVERGGVLVEFVKEWKGK